MKRRTFILTTIAAGTMVGMAVFFEDDKGSIKGKSPYMYPLILSGFCDENTIRHIGKSYRSLVPGENSKEKLMTLLEGDFKSKFNESSDYQLIVRQLEWQVENDFKKEKILIINNWVISETEARQCALLSLSSSDQI
jgi:hypothetical protein